MISFNFNGREKLLSLFLVLFNVCLKVIILGEQILNEEI